MMITTAFAPLQSLAATLLPHALEPSEDGAHDLSHLQRVWHNVRLLHAEEGGDLEVLLAAVLLHDCVAVEKNSPLRSQASRLAAQKASRVLAEMTWSSAKIAIVVHAIQAHSFSANIAPTSLEAKIMQDADRLDSLGMLGVARTFYVAGRMGSALYDPQDPEANERAYDDQRFCLDHFQTKLLHLADGFQTIAGQRLAQIRHDRLKGFMEQFKEEIGTGAPDTETTIALDLSQTLRQLEQRLLSEAVRGNAEEISCLIADDFTEIGASGNTWTKADLVELLPQQPFTPRTLNEFTVKQLSEHTALVTYRCHTDSVGQDPDTSSLRSSIWRRQGEQWQMVFHQGTSVPQR